MSDPMTIMMFLSLLQQQMRKPYARAPQAGPPGPPGGGGAAVPTANPAADAAQSAAVAADAAAQTTHPVAQQAAAVAADAAQKAATAPDVQTAQAHANTAADAAQAAVAVAKQDTGANAPLLHPTPAPSAAPGATPSMPPWSTSVVPSTLPPFPGPGWTPDTPVAATVAQRAQYWNPQLWNFATRQIVKPFVQEQWGGRWLTFVAAWHPDSQGNPVVMATEAWRLRNDTPAVDAAGPSVPTPDQQAAVQAAAAKTTPAKAPAAVPRTPPGQQGPLATSPIDNPVPVAPYPGPGAWQNNPGFIARYQAALTHLGYDTQGVDGRYGGNTKSAVEAFQRDHGLPVDGQVGPNTVPVLDAALSGGGVDMAEGQHAPAITPET